MGGRRRGLSHCIGDDLGPHRTSTNEDPFSRCFYRGDRGVRWGEEAVLIRPDAERFGKLNGLVARSRCK